MITPSVRDSRLWAGAWGVVLVVAFVVAPLRDTRSWLVAALMAVLASVVVIPFLWVRRRAAVARRPVLDAAVTVSLMLVTLVVGFSAIYVALAHEGDNLQGVETKVDAVYFTVTTLATVGFGDITPVSQSARVVVTIQMIFDLTIVAVAARLIFGVAQARAGDHSDDPPR